MRLTFLAALLTFTAIANGEPPFHVYAPSPGSKQLWVIAAKPSLSGIDLAVESKVDLGFPASTITLHPSKPILYVGAGGGTLDSVPAATVSLDTSGGVAGQQSFKLKHGTAYLSTDRSSRFLLSADYGSGAVDVYGLDENGAQTKWVAGRDEGRKEAHCILPPPDNRNIYIPYVKGNNALLQYRFDAKTGSLEPLEPANAMPPDGTGPRHMAYHPTLPVVYFTNEQGLGVSVYDRDSEGRLKFRNACEAVTAEQPKERNSASDIVITPDGRFLFSGVRGYDFIAGYRIAENGDLTLVSRTPADKTPWGFTLSPKAEFLFITAWEGATITAYKVGKDGSLEKAASIPCDKNITDIVAHSVLHAEDKPRFRTDADGPVKADDKRSNPKDRKPGDKPDWYQLVEGQFPPEGSAHAVSGELMKVDHLERRFQIRVDRNDSQLAGFHDLPLEAGLLPYGSVWYHGAPAALQDIPLGTHLHGLFYLSDPNDKTPLPETPNNRKTDEWQFRRCLRLEDDFTFYARQKQHWKIESVDLTKMKLTASPQSGGKGRDGKPAPSQTFDLLASTRVWKGRGFSDLKALQPGQTALFNLTWATLYGPGRITALWLDDESRSLATAQQVEVHRLHMRERGLPGFVSDVDDDKQIVTITFFDGVDPKLFDELKGINEEPQGWPFSFPEDDPKAPKGGIAVALPTLMTYDPGNDRKGGNIVAFGKVPVVPGCSGVQIKVKCGMMLEGYRPGRVVRFYPATWPVNALPQEERFEGRE
jgi:6-phosphogluconolactonase (cycloisomerase 2 family)